MSALRAVAVSRAAVSAIGGLLLVAFAIAAAAFAHFPLPVVASFVPSMVIIAIVGDFATFAVLLRQLRIERRRAIVVLAYAYALCGVVSIAFLLVNPFSPSQPPLIRAGPQTAPWLYSLWHCSFGLYAIAYAFMRRSDAAPVKSVRLMLVNIGVISAVVAVAIMLIATIGAPYLPVLVSGTDLSGLWFSGVGPGAGIVCAAACVAVWSFGRQRQLDRALALALLAISLDVFLALLAGKRFTVAWYASRVMYTLGSVFVYVAALRELMEIRWRSISVRPDADAHTQRLAELWEVAADLGRGIEPSIQAMLDTAARGIRPGRQFFGHIGHIENDDFVVDARVERSAKIGVHFLAVTPPAGSPIAARDAVHAHTLHAGETTGWNDVSFRRTAPRDPLTAGFRSAIGTKFYAGTQCYVFLLGSTEPTAPGFSAEDGAYVDVLASFFAARYERLQSIHAMHHASEHDALTGLPNRASLRAHCTSAIERGGAVALVVADLDHFHEINDTLGHETGDAVLVHIARMLERARLPEEFVARLGSDTFAIFIAGLPSADMACARAAEWHRLFAEPFFADTGENFDMIPLGASAGVAAGPDDAENYDQLLSYADAALDAAKRRGGKRLVRFAAEMGKAQTLSLRLRTELAEAIERDQLDLFYQPTIELATMNVSGFEALVRWHHPTRGLLLPVDFIPFAEDKGLIGEIGRWVLRRAVRDVVDFDTHAHGALRCFINLSSHQLDDAAFLIDLHAEITRRPGLSRKLGVEVTESVAMHDVERSMRTLQLIRDLGIPIALDDFGTGYSSLSHLKQLPIDIIKIDQRFVAGLPGDPHDRAIVETMLSIAARFGYKTQAEGVETQAQLEWLREHGCDAVQGYLFSRPLPRTIVPGWLPEYAALRG